MSTEISDKDQDIEQVIQGLSIVESDKPKYSIGSDALLLAIIRNDCAQQDTKMRSIKKLLALGTNINCLDDQGQTPLIAAIQTKSVPLSKLFAYHPSTKIAMRDLRGNTALDYAIAERDCPELTTLLLDAGEKRHETSLFTNVNAQGQTPERYAKSMGHDELSDQIRQCRERIASLTNQRTSMQRLAKANSVKTTSGGWVQYRRSLRKAPSMRVRSQTQSTGGQPIPGGGGQNAGDNSARSQSTSPKEDNERISFLSFIGSFHRKATPTN